MTAPSVREALELKPCPFCGAAGETLIRGFRYPEGSSQKEGAVWCPTCDCKGPEKAWNTRATPPAPTPSAARERIELAQRALRYLADHDRPQGGQSDFNAEHLHQIAGELALLPDAAAIRANEREKCARVAEGWITSSWNDEVFAARSIAADIRAEGGES